MKTKQNSNTYMLAETDTQFNKKTSSHMHAATDTHSKVREHILKEENTF